MAKLFQSNCATKFGNTGMPTTCTFNPGLIIGALAMPAGTVLTAAELADIQATLQAGLINTVYGSRYHLFGQWEGIESQGDEPQVQTYPYGRKVTTRAATYRFTQTFLTGGMCKQIAYLNFNYREDEFDYLLIDDAGNIIGTRGTTATELEGLAGISMAEFVTNNWMPKDGTNETVYTVTWEPANASDLNENIAYANIDFDVFSLNQVQDVEIKMLTADNEASAAGGFNIDVLAGCGNGNMVELFPSLINNVARFVATNKETGAAITITSVTIAGTAPNRYLTIDLDATDPDYPDSGDLIDFTMADVATLATAGIAYYEANHIDVISTTP